MAVPGGGTAHFPVFYIRHKGLQNIHQVGSEARYNRGCVSRLSIEREIEISGGPGSIAHWQACGLEKMELTIPPTVYPPREDTTLLDKVLAGLGSGHGRKLLEIGCGSGAISIASALRGWEVYACDINPLSVVATRGNCKKFGVELGSQICEGGPGDIEGWIPVDGVDVIAWNLPYVEFEGGPKLGPLEDSALIDQGESINLLESITKNPKMLNRGGIVLLLHSSNKFGRDLTMLWRKAGWATRNVESCNLGDEELTVVACWKPFEGAEIIRLDSCESTNDEIFNMSESVQGNLIIAKKQSSGRGHHGRTWGDSENGFMGSWNIHKNSIETGPWNIQMRGFISVLDTFSAIQNIGLPSHSWANCCEILQRGVRVKWPNDLWLRNGSDFGKLCGVIAESRSQGENMQIVLGIGINRFHTPSVEHSIGWDEFSNHNVDEMIPIIHASIASLFEDHPLVPAMQEEDVLSIAFCAMRMTFGEAAPQAFGLDSKGGLMLKEKTVHHTDEIVWKWV